MWRIGELHLVTGVDRENIKYYCRARKVDEHGVERGGAGLIEPVEKRGRVNYFNEDALFRLAIISHLSKCKMPIDEMRSVLDGKGDFEVVLDTSIVRLKRERAKINSSIRAAQILKRIYEAILENDDEKLEITLGECFMGELEEAIGALEREGKVCRELKPSAKLARVQKDLGALAKKRERLEEMGASHEEIVAIVAETADLLKGFTASGGTISEDPLVRIIELREEGLKPESREIQESVALLHENMGSAFDDLSAESFGILMEGVLTRNTLAVVMELSVGEGTIAYFAEALKTYCENERKGRCDGLGSKTT